MRAAPLRKPRTLFVLRRSVASGVASRRYSLVDTLALDLDRKDESRMNKPRIFLGSSGKQAELLDAIARGLDDVADVEPWTTTFNPGRSTLDRLVELSQEVDFAAFVFAQDDWTTTDASQARQASPRDNVVFEAGLFGGALGIRRTFILHANDSKLPSDLLGLTSVRYDPATSPAEVRAINQKLRKAIEAEGRRERILSIDRVEPCVASQNDVPCASVAIASRAL